MRCQQGKCTNETLRSAKYCSNDCRFINMRRVNMEMTMKRMRGIPWKAKDSCYLKLKDRKI